MSVPRSKAKFQPVIMIPDRDQTPLDQLAIGQLHQTYGIVRDSMNTERSKQTKIGISEFGDPCRKCVARKVAEAEMMNDPGWKAQVGTFGHSGLEDHFVESFPEMYEFAEPDKPGGKWKPRVRDDFVRTDENPAYHLERRVAVGEIERHNFLLDGSCDLFIEGATYGIVTDWKFQGPSTLKKSGSGNIGQKYHTQMNGYGRGYERLGFNVTHVMLFALPRDGELEEAKPVLMRYDGQMAIDALGRLGQLMDAAKIIGWDAVIDAQPKAGGCFDCRRYEEAEEKNFVLAMTGK